MNIQSNIPIPPINYARNVQYKIGELEVGEFIVVDLADQRRFKSIKWYHERKDKRFDLEAVDGEVRLTRIK